MLEIIQHGSVRELRLSRAPVNALNTELISALDAAIALAETEAAGEEPTAFTATTSKL